MAYERSEFLIIIVDILLIVYSLFFIIKAKTIAKLIEKSGKYKKDSKRVDKLRIWGIIFFIIGIILLFWIIFG